MKLKSIISDIHNLLNDSLFCERSLKSALQYYWYLDKKKVKKIKYRASSCSSIANKLQELLFFKYDIETDFIFLYSEPFCLKFKFGEYIFNREYLKLVKNKKYEEIKNFLDKNIMILPRYENARNTHAMLEILVDKEKYVIDPTCGIFYFAGKEDLLRGNGIYESLHSYNQIELLNKSIQYGNFTLFYSSVMYWNSVYHISYDRVGGLPILK